MTAVERAIIEHIWQWGACGAERIGEAVRSYCPQTVEQPDCPRVWYEDEAEPPPLEVRDATSHERTVWVCGQLHHLKASGLVELKRNDRRWHLTAAGQNLVIYGTTWKCG